MPSADHTFMKINVRLRRRWALRAAGAVGRSPLPASVRGPLTASLCGLIRAETFVGRRRLGVIRAAVRYAPDTRTIHVSARDPGYAAGGIIKPGTIVRFGTGEAETVPLAQKDRKRG